MKTAVVTGANTGMGYETTVALAKKGYRVVMLCRSKERGAAAEKQAIQESGSSAIDLIQCDLSSFQSIRQAAYSLREKYPAIDVLINNAGVVTLKKEYTENGFEQMMGVNYLGHFLLTQLVLPSLKKAAEARIVVVSSNAYRFSPLNLKDFNSEHAFTPWKNYGRSKLANLLFAKELAKRVAKDGITVNAVHPGAVATSLGINRQTGFGQFAYTLLGPFFKTAKEGAATAIYAATAKELSHTTGKYLVDKKIKEVSGEAADPQLAAELYEFSEQLIHQFGSVETWQTIEKKTNV